MKKPKHQPDTDNKRNNKIAQRKIHTKELLYIDNKITINELIKYHFRDWVKRYLKISGK